MTNIEVIMNIILLEQMDKLAREYGYCSAQYCALEEAENAHRNKIVPHQED